MFRVRVQVLLLLLVGAMPAMFLMAETARANPLAGAKLFVDHESPSWLQWRAFQRAGESRKADLIWKIAREPKNVWFGSFTRPASQFRGKVRRPIDAAEAQGSIPVLTVLRAESTQCNPSYQAGGPAEDRRTREWYDKFANTIGNSRVAVAFEPDSLGTIHCHAPSRRDDRIRLLRYGVDALARLPNTTVYIEAGASDWMKPGQAASLLRRVGVAKVRGFMLNATHQDWTAGNIRHGLKISRLLGGKHFVVNTAENGRGPFRRGGSNVWCNPPGRGLGPPPTTNTSHPMVDAYLWINRPGYGQSCAGQKIAWNVGRALAYARRATSWERPPGGARRRR